MRRIVTTASALLLMGSTALGQELESEPQDQAPPGPEAVLPDEPNPPDQLRVAKEGWFQPSALLQGWVVLREQDETAFTFRIRRAELKIKGEIIPDLLAYSVMVDPAKTLRFGQRTVDVEPVDPADPQQVTVPTPPEDTSILQDFYVTLLTDYADVSLGQFKTPLSWEGYNSSSKLLMPDRALVSKHYGDRRDIGIRVEKEFQYFKYLAGVFNGDGVNRLDSNVQKDVSLRLEAFPIEGLMLGVVGYTSVGERDEVPTTKDRFELDARLEIASALVQAEYLHGWDGPSGTRVEGHGAYGALGYTFVDVLQPVVRIGFLNPSLDVSGDATNHYEVGLNYYVSGHQAKLQASYSLFDFEDEAETLAHEAILAAQLSF